MRLRTAVIIAPAWPAHDNGYGLAIRSNLIHHAGSYDKVVFIGVTSDDLPVPLQSVGGRIDFRHVPIRTAAPWLRFGRSLISTIPAVAIRFASPRIWRRVLRICEEYHSGLETIVLEDVPLGAGARILASNLPSRVQIVLRSHNVLSQAFEDFSRRGSLAKRWVWQIENRKITAFERSVLEGVTEVIAISDSDAYEYKARYQIERPAVRRVQIDTSRYEDVSRGSPNTIISVGSADIRKGHGLRSFLDEVWPRINRRFPAARLVLGGRGTEAYDDPSKSVEGRGYVSDEISVLQEGLVFLNTQTVGSGVQLKSLVALASGKLLVSTAKGVSGVDGEAGRDFLVYRSEDEAADLLGQVLSGEIDYEPIIRRGRTLVNGLYGQNGSDLAALI